MTRANRSDERSKPPRAARKGAGAGAAPPIAERLAGVRKRMAAAGVDVLLVRSTDRWLNEYVPLDESARVWVTGFTGSAGEVMITEDQAFLAVDGRYWTQAEQTVDPALYTVLRVPLGTGIDETLAERLRALRDAAAPKKLVIGFEPDRVTTYTLEWLKKQLGDGASWKPLFPSPVEAARGAARPPAREGTIRVVDERKVGRTVEEKLEELGTKLESLGADALLVQRLDEIAYLSNLRGDELPYQATFKAVAIATRERLIVGMDPAKAKSPVRVARDDVMFVPEAELWTMVGRRSKRPRVLFDKAGSTELTRSLLEKTGAKLVFADSPVGPMKAKKNPAELAAMVGAFRRADAVVDGAARWLMNEVTAGRRVTEANFAEKVKSAFLESGATGLSFRVISAAGKNGAIIHYSDPNDRRVIKEGELMLLDTGAYYEEGYATDLTRTFLVAGPRAKGDASQRYYFTAVLKAAIAGMTAILPEGSKGGQLDAITRAPLWALGLNYNHGTGHGVGINVHEAPPRIGPNATSVLEEGFVFSIEPGVYLPDFGGIRIENLCVLEKAAKKPGFLAVQPLTFSPLDDRLIDPKLLAPSEKAFLRAYAKRYSRPRTRA